jgi:hypothetical protein
MAGPVMTDHVMPLHDRGGGPGSSVWITDEPRRPRSPVRLGLFGVCAGVAAVMIVCSFATSSSAAPAGCPQPLRDRYEAGDEITIVGYTDGCLPDPPESGAGDRQPLFGYLHPDPCNDVGPTEPPHMCDPAALFRREPPVDVAKGTPVGPFAVDETVHEPRGLRMSLTFELPPDLASGVYYVLICQDPCVDLGGSFYALPWPIYVGVDPPGGQGPARQWPLDDPAIADLPDDALLFDRYGDEVTAAEVRATAAAAEDGASDRVKTGAAPAKTRDTHDDGPRPALWVAAAGIAVAAGWAVARSGRTRKRIRRRP